ncbi:T9SS type A sorting domain-containing protein [Parvicella tangerina]|uniref:Secretion system C-terminal sorting domain-containing protein n=1 Tax=Parvicella tangerina TaxID=2829795 RepID=A0A916NR68_9FLAO|nr:T9SS type A sorting domain-containing protein [Parvicella tangerina]CAG5080520.1 hypothetical protein CRYO30217_01354 [Parvicella tangerina]
MKKTLLSALLLGGMYAASAQCTPDPSITSGISPDTLTGMAVSYVGQAYEEVFTFVVPTDTMGLTIDYIKLNNVTGLPSNYDYDCTPSNCEFPAGSSQCARVFSTSNPTTPQIGSYQLTIEAMAYVILLGQSVANPQGATTYDGYYLVIADAATAGVEQVGKGDMKSLIAYPNPTNGNTTVEFAMGYNTEVTFTVTNLLGEVVNRQVIAAPKGLNRINFDASNMSNGVYLYTITDGKNSISKKLIVNK